MNWVHTSLCSTNMHHPQMGRVTQTSKGLFLGSNWEVSSAAVKSAETQSVMSPKQQIKVPLLLADETRPSQSLQY